MEAVFFSETSIESQGMTGLKHHRAEFCADAVVRTSDSAFLSLVPGLNTALKHAGVSSYLYVLMYRALQKLANLRAFLYRPIGQLCERTLIYRGRTKL
jgi:hypothetical protein